MISIENNETNELKCVKHEIPKGEYKELFFLEKLKEWDNSVETIYINERNVKLFKVFCLNEKYTLIRHKNNKVEAWEFEEDFNLISALKFMKTWDKIYPFENRVSVAPLAYDKLKKSLKRIARVKTRRKIYLRHNT